MLTLHKPIVIKAGRYLLKMKEGMAQRIQANYEIMAVRLTPADMLHFIAAPPDVYLYGDEMAPLVNQSDITNNQIMKLQLINNMLNRILVSDTFPLTYQDSVFVEHIMNKIGVTDGKKLIRQFWLMQNDMRNVRQLNALYQSERQIFEVYQGHLKEILIYQKVQNEESREAQKSEYWLHQSILDRLRTGEIYSEIRDFAVAAYGGGNEIHVSEIQVSEQAISAQYILLNKCKNEAHMESQVLVYNHLNSYELGDVAVFNENYEQAVSDMVGAVLLNVLTQTYAVCMERQMQTQNNWYTITDFLYQSAQNTLRRFESCYNRFLLQKSGKEEYYETLQHYQKAEIHILQTILENQSAEQFNVDNIHNAAVREYKYNAVSQYETNDRTQNNETAITYADTINHHAVSNIKEDGSNVSREEQIFQQLERIRQNNLERMERIRQISSQNPKKRSQKIDMEKTREDLLRTIETPDAMVLEYMHSENHNNIDNILQNRELRQVLGEETIRAFEEIKSIQERSDTSGGMEEESIKAFDMLVHDVAAVRMMEQIRNIHTEQYAEELERAKSVIHTDLETQHHEKYDTSVINRQKTADIQNDIEEHYERIRSQTQRSNEVIGKNLELFHKQTENRISEETLEELIESRKQMHSGSTKMTEKFRETNGMIENVNNSYNVIELQQKNDIAQMVAQNINRQLGELSEQVYTKLERRMDSERRRRGL